MKKIGLILITAVLVFGFSSCDTAQSLTEAETVEVLEALSNATTGAIYTENGEFFSRAAINEDGKGITSGFTSEQDAGGTAKFTLLTEEDGDLEGGLGSGAVYIDVTFTDYIADEYTLNGTMYMEWGIGFTSTSNLEYTFLFYTDPADTLSIANGSIETTLDVNITNTLELSMGIGETFLTVNYTVTGTCNGYTFNDESGEMTVSF